MINFSRFFDANKVSATIYHDNSRSSWDSSSSEICNLRAVLAKASESGLNPASGDDSSSMSVRLFFDVDDIMYTNENHKISMGDRVDINGISYEIMDIDFRSVLPVDGCTCSIRCKRVR